jgi:hypothetical protein
MIWSNLRHRNYSQSIYLRFTHSETSWSTLLLLAGLELLIVLVLHPFHSHELYRFYPHKKEESDQYRYYESKLCHTDLCVLSLDFGELIPNTYVTLWVLDCHIFITSDLILIF